MLSFFHIWIRWPACVWCEMSRPTSVMRLGFDPELDCSLYAKTDAGRSGTAPDSVVNFSTWGYDDIVMTESRCLLGALEALNGVLMIGLSMGALFAVLNALMQRAWAERDSLTQAKADQRLKQGGSCSSPSLFTSACHSIQTRRIKQS